MGSRTNFSTGRTAGGHCASGDALRPEGDHRHRPRPRLRGARQGSIEVKDAYSTDAKIAEYDLVALDDDLKFFPKYEAVFLYRLNLAPAALAALRKIEGTLDESRMIRLNAEAERTKNYSRAADLYFSPNANRNQPAGESLQHKLMRWTRRHLQLAGFSLLLAILAGVPLGIVASRGGVLGQAILAFAGIVQTIPSLALLALLVPIPFFGISPRTAIAALFLYGLLPIVRNTATGLQDIAPRCANRQSRLVWNPARGCAKFICQSPRAPFSQE